MSAEAIPDEELLEEILSEMDEDTNILEGGQPAQLTNIYLRLAWKPTLYTLILVKGGLSQIPSQSHDCSLHLSLNSFRYIFNNFIEPLSTMAFRSMFQAFAILFPKKSEESRRACQLFSFIPFIFTW